MVTRATITSQITQAEADLAHWETAYTEADLAVSAAETALEQARTRLFRVGDARTSTNLRIECLRRELEAVPEE